MLNISPLCLIPKAPTCLQSSQLTIKAQQQADIAEIKARQAAERQALNQANKSLEQKFSSELTAAINKIKPDDRLNALGNLLNKMKTWWESQYKDSQIRFLYDRTRFYENLIEEISTVSDLITRLDSR